MKEKTSLSDEVFKKYSWNLKGKGEPHTIHGHNIDLGKAIRDTIKLTKPKISKWAKKSNQKIINSIFKK